MPTISDWWNSLKPEYRTVYVICFSVLIIMFFICMIAYFTNGGTIIDLIKYTIRVKTKDESARQALIDEKIEKNKKE